MQISLNTQNYNSSTNFTALKKVSGGKALSQLIGEDGFAIEEKIVNNLKANDSFKRLCEKFDVFVEITPYARPVGILLDKVLSLEIFAKKIGKKGFLGLFSKRFPKESVSAYYASGTEVQTWKLADHIIDRYINTKEGMEVDINKFLVMSYKRTKQALQG